MTRSLRDTPPPRKALANIPAATLLRAQPGTPLAVTRTGTTVHVLNRPAGRPLCGPRGGLAEVPVNPATPPAARLCQLCSVHLPGALRARLRGAGAPTEAELAHLDTGTRRTTTPDGQQL